MMNFKPSPKLITAGIVAGVADFIQFSLIGASLGVLNPLNVIIDFVVGAIMVKMLGWHWAFVPSFMGEMIPGVSLVPSWTMAVFIVGMSSGELTEPQASSHPSMPTTVMPGVLPPTMPHPTHVQPQRQLTVPANTAPIVPH